MKRNYNEILDGKLVAKALDIIPVLTVVFYILYSALKRFTDNVQLLWIPFVFFIFNFLFPLALVYLIKTNQLNSTKKELTSLIYQSLINLGLAIFIISYFF
jgi:predicted MFS family arabinose efflux permease